jgi:hypothetical protein
MTTPADKNKINEIFKLIASIEGDDVRADLEVEAIRFPRADGSCGNDGNDYYFKRIDELNDDEAKIVLEELQRAKSAKDAGGIQPKP